MDQAERIKSARHGWPGSLLHPAFWVSTWFGSGLLRPAPGTWGSAAALPFAYAIIAVNARFSALVLLAAATAVLAIGAHCAGRYCAAAERADASEVVIDEVAGQWLALVPVAYWAPHDALAWLAAFILFRLFDIAKPWPASWLDHHVKGGWGVMLDDVAAGGYAAAMLWAWFSLWS